jgi:hypothetical protein
LQLPLWQILAGLTRIAVERSLACRRCGKALFPGISNLKPDPSSGVGVAGGRAADGGHDAMKQKTTIRRLGEIREDRTDWRRVDAQCEEELAAAIRADPDDEELDPAGPSVP